MEQFGEQSQQALHAGQAAVNETQRHLPDLIRQAESLANRLRGTCVNLEEMRNRTLGATPSVSGNPEATEKPSDIAEVHQLRDVLHEAEEALCNVENIVADFQNL